MLAGEEDEVYPITYIISLFSSSVPCPQLVQISETLVQLMGFAIVFIVWGFGQSCFLQQLRSFSLFLTTPVGFNSVLCLWDCKLLWPKLHFLCGSRSTCLPLRIQPWLQAAPCPQAWAGKPSANQSQILKIRLHERLQHNFSTQWWALHQKRTTNVWLCYQFQIGLTIHVRGFPYFS